MKINLNIEIGEKAIKNLIEITKKEDYKKIQEEILKEVFKE